MSPSFDIISKHAVLVAILIIYGFAKSWRMEKRCCFPRVFDCHLVADPSQDKTSALKTSHKSSETL